MNTTTRFEGINALVGAQTAADRMAGQSGLFDMAAHKEGRIPVEHTGVVEKNLVELAYFGTVPEPFLAGHGLEAAVDSWHTLDVLAGQKFGLLSMHSRLV